MGRLLYTTLDASQREIRLLRVLPAAADDEDAIHCELSVHRLNHGGGGTTTPYKALSYVWGPEPGPGQPTTTTTAAKTTLTVNNAVIPARENLISALQAFRRGGGGGGGGYIWVDAVCINQDDREEKKTQIPLMCDIYGLAAQTLIWLGAAEGDSDLAMDTLDKLSPKDFEGVRFGEEQGRRWRAIMALLQRPWCKSSLSSVDLLAVIDGEVDFFSFQTTPGTRTWIVQEVFLSPKPIAWCGDRSFPFERFVTLKELYEASYWESQEKWLAYLLFQNVPFTSCLSNWNITKTQLARGGDAIFSWIATTSHRLECTEPLDRIYGVLGMCYRENREAIVADYDRQLRDVIIDVVVRSLPTLDLLFLSFVGPEDARSQELGLPTWVPDVTALDMTQRVNSARSPAHMFDASLGAYHPAWATLFGNSPLLSAAESGTPFSVSREKELLCLYGCLCDIITYADAMPLVPQYTGYDTELAAENKAQRARVTIETFRKWEPLAVAAGGTTPGGVDVYASLPGGRKEAFWRSLSCDSAVRGERPLPGDYGERYETLVAHDDGFEPMKNDWVRSYGVHAVAKCHNKSLFLTHRGRIGVGVRGAKKDDVVVIARGGTVPYVVRRVGDGTFRFVGEAYVHGVTDGEAVEEAAALGWPIIPFLLR